MIVPATMAALARLWAVPVDDLSRFMDGYRQHAEGETLRQATLDARAKLRRMIGWKQWGRFLRSCNEFTRWPIGGRRK